MRIRMLLTAALAAGALGALALAAQAAMSPVVSAKLVGKVEVPKGSPTGSGIVVLHLNAKKGTVCWTFEKVKGIGTPLAAHIHKAPAGKAGPIAWQMHNKSLFDEYKDVRFETDPISDKLITVDE